MTITELEALIGHLFVVGGRAISAASPGAIASPPPRRTARGRDNDTFFALLTLNTDERQPAIFYEQLTSTAADKYFKVTGSVTAALREAITDVNAAVSDLNEKRDDPLSVGFACAIMREQEVYIAVSGPARCFLVREGFAERLPEDVDVEEGLLPLGLYDEPDIRFFRRDIRTGDFLILADSSFNRLTDETLLHAVQSGEVDAALNNLASVASQFSAAEVIQFVSPLPEGEVDPLPETKKPRVPPLPSFGRSADPGAEQMEAVEQPAGTAVESIEQQASAGAADVGELETGLESEEKTTVDAGEIAQKIGHRSALGLARVTEGLRTLVERMLPDSEANNPLAQRFQLSTTMQIAIAVAVALLVALVTTAVYRFRGQTSQYARLVREAQLEVEEARAAAGDQAEARPHWENVIFLLEQAAAIRAPGDETENLRAEARRALDSYDHVTRVQPQLLRAYEPGTYLRGPVVQGLNIYVIDTTKDILYREDLNDEGTELVNRTSQIVTRQGDTVGNQVVGGLIDLIWMEEGGTPQRNVLAALSRNGLLLTYSPSFDIAAALLPGFEAWRDPRAMALYEGDLYLLDAGANEIWRYEASGTAYPNAPQRYFTDVTPELTDAIDLEIDTNGNLYVLHSSGRISKYFFGRPEPFEFSQLPQPLSRPTAFYLNLSLFDRGLFIADPGGGRLYSTALNGAFLANYKDTDGSIFESLSGVYNLDQPPFVYVTTGDQLYYFSRP